MPYISKNPLRSFGKDFLELKKAGVEYIQHTSGEKWTDFNHHDPGVTILEQLCYGLTEFAHQGDLNLQDIFADPDTGKMDFRKLGLTMPREVFSHHPLRPLHYSMLLYDGVLGIANAWVKPVGKTGLYRMYIYTFDVDTYRVESEKQRIIDEARQIFLKNRNLGEDLIDITILKYKEIDISADIMLDTNRLPHDVLTDIMVSLQKCLSPALRLWSLDEHLDEGKSLQEIYAGPQLEYGIITENQYREKPEFTNVQNLVEQINKVSDVANVRSIDLSLPGGTAQTEIWAEHDEILTFRFNSEHITESLRLFQNSSGRRINVSSGLLTKRYYNNLNMQRRVYRPTDQQVKHNRVSTLSSHLYDYYSIQNDFPAIYGINRMGLSSSESELRKAQAKQLKAYLLLCEYILAGAMQLPSSMRKLLSSSDAESSYPFVFLRDENVPGCEGLYLEEAETENDVAAGMHRVHQLQDNYVNRKSRAFDYLISMYGETCSMNSVSQFNRYTDGNNEESKLNAKKQFLKHINQLSYNRAAAFDYSELYNPYNNISGVEQKARILLDIQSKGHSVIERSCRTIFQTYGLEVKSTSLLEETHCYSDATDSGRAITITYNDRAAELYFQEVDFLRSVTLDDSAYYQLLKNLRVYSSEIVDTELLINGVDLENYRLGKINKQGLYLILLRSMHRGQIVWRNIGEARDAQTACNMVLTSQRLCKELSIESENMHVLEHVLLRPIANEHNKISDELRKSFYTGRISVFLPNWTARFSDPGYQALVKETLMLLIPAHLSTHIYWLNPEQMCDFEKRFNKWLSQKSAENELAETLDVLAADIRDFIVNLDPDSYTDALINSDSPEL